MIKLFEVSSRILFIQSKTFCFLIHMCVIAKNGCKWVFRNLINVCWYYCIVSKFEKEHDIYSIRLMWFKTILSKYCLNSVVEFHVEKRVTLKYSNRHFTHINHVNFVSCYGTFCIKTQNLRNETPVEHRTLSGLYYFSAIFWGHKSIQYFTRLTRKLHKVQNFLYFFNLGTLFLQNFGHLSKQYSAYQVNICFVVELCEV